MRSRARARRTARLTPLAFPIWAEFVQSRLTTKDWLMQIADMARDLEQAAGHGG